MLFIILEYLVGNMAAKSFRGYSYPAPLYLNVGIGMQQPSFPENYRETLIYLKQTRLREVLASFTSCSDSSDHHGFHTASTHQDSCA